MEVVREFTLHFTLGETIPVGGGPYGERTVATVGEGWAKGERITGHLVGPSADWAIVGSDGYAEIDVRAQIRTDDGADIYLRYSGSLEANEPAMAALLGEGETSFGDNYWFTHVRLESGAEEYRWVNRTLFVGQGRAANDGIEYEVYRLS